MLNGSLWRFKSKVIINKNDAFPNSNSILNHIKRNIIAINWQKNNISKYQKRAISYFLIIS